MPAFAFIFPGQGSQSVGMLDPWGDHPVVRAVLDEASHTLGEDIGALIRNGPKDVLDQTTNTQPAMLAASIACYRAWLHDTGLEPSMLAGHSLGEYSALVAAGVLQLGAAVALVRFRAQAMQDAVPIGRGGMAAILGLDADAVRAACAQAAAQTGQAVEPANYNDPKQTVISGAQEAVNKACDLLKAAGAKRTLPLAVSAPFHSSLMQPAADRLRERLAQVQLALPRIPVVNNIDVATESAPDAIRDALSRQASGAVRWVETVQVLKARGITRLVECGPGRVLVGLCKRIDPDLLTANVADPSTLADTRGLLA